MWESALLQFITAGLAAVLFGIPMAWAFGMSPPKSIEREVLKKRYGITTQENKFLYDGVLYDDFEEAVAKARLKASDTQSI